MCNDKWACVSLLAFLHSQLSLFPTGGVAIHAVNSVDDVHILERSGLQLAAVRTVQVVPLLLHCPGLSVSRFHCPVNTHTQVRYTD